MKTRIVHIKRSNGDEDFYAQYKEDAGILKLITLSFLYVLFYTILLFDKGLKEFEMFNCLFFKDIRRESQHFNYQIYQTERIDFYSCGSLEEAKKKIDTLILQEEQKKRINLDEKLRKRYTKTIIKHP